MIEIEDLKNEWSEMHENELKNDFFSKQSISTIINDRSSRQMLKVLVLETVVSGLSLFCLATLLIHLKSIDSWLLAMISGMVAMMLIIIPTVRWSYLYGLYVKVSLKDTPQETYERLLNLQLHYYKWNPFLTVVNFITVIGVIVVGTKIYNEYDVTQFSSFWIIVILIAIGFIFFVEKCIGRPLRNRMDKAEMQLQNLLEVDEHE